MELVETGRAVRKVVTGLSRDGGLKIKEKYKRSGGWREGEREKGKEGEKISNCSDFSKVQSPSQADPP